MPQPCRCGGASRPGTALVHDDDVRVCPTRWVETCPKQSGRRRPLPAAPVYMSSSISSRSSRHRLALPDPRGPRVQACAACQTALTASRGRTQRDRPPLNRRSFTSQLQLLQLHPSPLSSRLALVDSTRLELESRALSLFLGRPPLAERLLPSPHPTRSNNRRPPNSRLQTTYAPELEPSCPPSQDRSLELARSGSLSCPSHPHPSQSHRILSYPILSHPAVCADLAS